MIEEMHNGNDEQHDDPFATFRDDLSSVDSIDNFPDDLSLVGSDSSSRHDLVDDDDDDGIGFGFFLRVRN